MSVSGRSISETAPSGRFDKVKGAVASVASLVDPSGDPDPQGHVHASTETIRVSYDVNRPEDDALQDYWDTYEKNPIVRRMISNFASEVVEPGWFITADDEELKEELTEFLEQVAIVDGEVNRNFIDVAEQAVVQREVRGTVLIEKVRDNDGNYTALNPLNPETFEIYTKPGKAILLAPDDHQEFDDIKLTEGGDAAAYVQFDDKWDRFRNRQEKRFTRDQLIKIVRDADVGEVFGTSVIEPIQDRSDALRDKLQDNDDAIATKAWPIIIFQGGPDDEPWSREEMEDFMDNLDIENIQPGTMIGVGGDMGLETFSGEVADIGDSLDFDLNWNIAAMPGPSYAIGGFEENVGQPIATQQAAEFRKEIRKMRRDLENKFTPFLKEIAEQYDLTNNTSAIDSIQLHITRPDGLVPPEDISGNIIRYESTSPQGGNGGQPLPGSNSSPGGDGENENMPDIRGSPRQLSRRPSVWQDREDLTTNA